MPLKKNLTVLTVSFCEKRKEMKMLDETIVATSFFALDRFTHGYLFYATKQRTIKKIVIHYEI